MALGWTLAIKEVDGVVYTPAGLTLQDAARSDAGWDDLVVELESVGLQGSRNHHKTTFTSGQ